MNPFCVLSRINIRRTVLVHEVPGSTAGVHSHRPVAVHISGDRTPASSTGYSLVSESSASTFTVAGMHVSCVLADDSCASHVCCSVLLWPSSTFQRCSLARPYLVLVRSFVRGWGSHHQPVPLHHALAVTHLLSRPAAIIYPPSCLFVSGRVCHRHAFCHN